MSLQQFTTQFTPPLQRLICEYMGRGFTLIVCPEYFGSLYGVMEGRSQRDQRSSEMIGREGDVLSCSMIPHDIDVEHVARGAAAADSVDLIVYLMTNRNSRLLFNGLMWGYTSAGNYDGFQRTYKTLLENFGESCVGLWTFEAVVHALAGALIHIETDAGAFAKKIAAETKFLAHHSLFWVIRVILRDVKKYNPLVIDWLKMRLAEREKRGSDALQALSKLKDAIAVGERAPPYPLAAICGASKLKAPMLQ